MRRVPAETVAAYIKDKLDFAASKCEPFVTLSVGAPLLPEKAYAVMHPDYQRSLGGYLSHLSTHRVDKEQLIAGEDPHQIVFYTAQLGCPLHSVKSLVDYERRYFVVKQKELTEASKVPGLPPGVPQIPLHQDKTWEGAPEMEARLFRISIEGVKESDSKLAWSERMSKRRDRQGEAAVTSDDLRDFTMGVAFGAIRFVKGGAAGDGYYLDDPDLGEDQRRLGKFRDQAFAGYRGRVDMQKAWLRKRWKSLYSKLEEDRETAKISAVMDEHTADLERLVKTADSVGGKPALEQAQRELAAVAAFRREHGL
jgi:hypothetical protein